MNLFYFLIINNKQSKNQNLFELLFNLYKIFYCDKNLFLYR